MKRILFIILIIILLVLIGIRLYRDYSQYRLLKQEVERLTLQQKNLQQEKEKLEKLQQAGSKAEILEKWARTIMGMKKEGEEVVLVTPVININETTNSTSTLTATSSNSFIVKVKEIWYDFLKRIKKTN